MFTLSRPGCVDAITNLRYTVHRSFVYQLAIVFVTIVVRVMYRHIEIRGMENVPEDGGIIIAAAPHQNQMFDKRVPLEPR